MCILSLPYFKHQGRYVDTYLQSLRHLIRERLADFSGIQMLGQAREFLESFDWTNDAVRDIESVNLNGMHTIGCGYRVRTR